MTSPDALAGQLGLRNRRVRISLFHRVLAVVRAPTLDADLAAGIRPWATPVSLATSIATDENLPVRGLAIASQLASDGGGALYFQFDESPPPLDR